MTTTCDNRPSENLVYPEIDRDNWHRDSRTWALCKLLIEARDALPAITLTVARLHNLDLTLGDRIEEALKPWAVKEGGI